jgi:hypothetical protein
MASSRRDYDLIARSLRAANAALVSVATNKKAEVIVEQSFDVLILTIAEEFQATFTNFDRDRFLFSVYVDDMDKYERMRTSHVELPDS